MHSYLACQSFLSNTETIVNQPVSDNNNSVRFDIGANADARRRRDAAIQTILLDTPDAGFLSNMSLISIPHDVDEVQTILDSNSLDPLTLEESNFSLTSFMHPINDTLTEGRWASTPIGLSLGLSITLASGDVPLPSGAFLSNKLCPLTIAAPHRSMLQCAF